MKKKKPSSKKKTKKKEKHPLKMGRKNKYYTNVQPKLELITAWCRNGALEEQIYKKLGVSCESFYRYKREHVELYDALKNGKDDVDDLVESALLKRALGFKEKVRKPLKVKVDMYEEQIVYADEEIYYPPDTTAQIFWLKNRRRGEWVNSDRISVETNSNHASKETNDVLNAISEQVIEKMKNKNVKEDIDPLTTEEVEEKVDEKDD
jgi:hypothetical protein